MYFYPLGGCLSCSFRKTGYYSQPLITSKSAGPEVDVLSGFHCSVSTAVDVRKKLGESRIGCFRRPDPAIPIEVDDDRGLFIMQLLWDPRWRVGEIVNATQFKSSR